VTIPGKSTLERAFDIAASGQAQDVRQINRALKIEGYDVSQVMRAGNSLQKQLMQRIKKARLAVIPA
jgi:hypothetical protein